MRDLKVEMLASGKAAIQAKIRSFSPLKTLETVKNMCIERYQCEEADMDIDVQGFYE